MLCSCCLFLKFRTIHTSWPMSPLIAYVHNIVWECWFLICSDIMMNTVILNLNGKKCGRYTRSHISSSETHDVCIFFFTDAVQISCCFRNRAHSTLITSSIETSEHLQNLSTCWASTTYATLNDDDAWVFGKSLTHKTWLLPSGYRGRSSVQALRASLEWGTLLLPRIKTNALIHTSSAWRTWCWTSP